MTTIAEPVILISEMANEQPMCLSGAKVEDSGHCKFCNNSGNYSN